MNERQSKAAEIGIFTVAKPQLSLHEICFIKFKLIFKVSDPKPVEKLQDPFTK